MSRAARKSAQLCFNSPLMKSFAQWAIALLTALAAAGCASSGQVTQRYNDRCAERGYQAGSDAFRNCVAQLESESALRRDARHREMVERSGAPSFGR
jgi:hypothetical protein